MLSGNIWPLKSADPVFSINHEIPPIINKLTGLTADVKKDF